MNFNIIKKLTSLISINGFKTLLFNRVKEAFLSSFNETNSDFGWQSKPNPDVLKYLETRETILSKKTLGRLTGNLEFTILESVKNRESITEVKARLNDIFTGMKDYEIERIARTETLNAFQEGEFQSHLESGVAEWKMWKANMNNIRTGSDSKRLNGQIQPIDKEFVDPLTGDTCMHSPNRPNCRCTILYLYKLPETKMKNGLMYKV